MTSTRAPFSVTGMWQQLGIAHPIIQAPMAGPPSHPNLTAAVSNAGALGSYGAGLLPAEKITQVIAEIRALTDRPFNINLMVPSGAEESEEEHAFALRVLAPYYRELDVEPPTKSSLIVFEEQMEVVIEARVPVFSFTFGIPDPHWIEQLKKTGAFIIGTATHLAEALELEKRGVDAIVAQGSEAGGHRSTFIGPEKGALIGTMALVPQLLAHTQLPIIAAGGIMNADGIRAALDLGAQAVQMGTAFLTADECPIRPAWKEKLLSLKADDTTLTRAFTGRYARGIRNRFAEEMHPHQQKLPAFPFQGRLTAPLRVTGNPDFQSMWAGQGAPLCQSKPAATLIAEWTQ